jgi:hypothetical protein
MATSGDRVPVDRAIAREACFTVPLLLTRRAYDDCVAWSDDDTHRTGVPQDKEGRLWDVLWLAQSSATAQLPGWLELSDPGEESVAFSVYRVPRDLDRSRVAELEDADELAQPVRLVLRRDGWSRGLVIDFAEAAI